MQFKRDDLTASLKKVAAIIPNKPVLDVSNYALMERDVNSGLLTIVANNIEVTRKINFSVDPGQNFQSVLIPVKRILEYLLRVTEDDIELVFDNPKVMQLKHGSKYVKFNCLDSQNFPRFGANKTEVASAVLESADFKKAVRQVLFACPGMHANQVLTGIGVNILPGRIVLCSTNTKVIAQSKAKTLKDNEAGKFLIPGKHLQNLIKVLEDDYVKVVINDRTATFVCGNLEEETLGLSGVHPVNQKFFFLKMSWLILALTGRIF